MQAETSTTLLRPQQIAEGREELSRLDGILNAPPHIRARISDPRMMRKRRDSLKSELDRFTPRAYARDEVDGAIKELANLEDDIRRGMPSSVEMRRNPPGAVQKHMEWDKKAKAKVLRMKHIGLRLDAGGDLPSNIGYAGEIGNVERLRPLESVRDLPMDGAQIAKTRDFHIGRDGANQVILSDAEIKAVGELDSELASSLALLPADKRAAVKAIVAKLLEPDTKPQVKDRPELKVKRARAMSDYRREKTLANKNGIKTFGRRREEIQADLAARGLAI